MWTLFILLGIGSTRREQKLKPYIAPDSDDYLHDLLLGNMFATHALLFRKSLLDRVGFMLNIKQKIGNIGFGCAKMGARFGRLNLILAAARQTPKSDQTGATDQGRRFFEAINVIFDGTMAPEYEYLKNLSVIRSCFYLMQKLLGLGIEARSETAIRSWALAYTG